MGYSEPTNGTDHNLTLAAKVDADTVSGAYETTLNFHAVTNAVPLVTLEMSYGFHGKQKVTVGNEEYYKMQDMTTEICSYTNEIPSQLEVVDIRDNTIYHIAKLQDGRCWLQDNLALDLTDSTVQANMDSSNTNTDATALNALFNGGRVSGDSTTNNLATTGVANWTSGYSFSAPLMNASSKAIVPTTTDQGADEPMAAEAIAGDWKVGIYYNYCAATAGTYCYGNGTNAGTSVDKPKTAIDTEYDICPSGWRMPTGYTKTTGEDSDRPDGGEFQDLYDQYNGTSSGTGEGSKYRSFRLAFRFPLSGYFMYGYPRNQGDGGDLWCSTYSNNANMRAVGVSTEFIATLGADNRYLGHSVRCIAK